MLARATAEPDARLTAAGISALIYGVLDPEDLVVRGLAGIGHDAVQRPRRLFPSRLPLLPDFGIGVNSGRRGPAG